MSLLLHQGLLYNVGILLVLSKRRAVLLDCWFEKRQNIRVQRSVLKVAVIPVGICCMFCHRLLSALLSLGSKLGEKYRCHHEILVNCLI
ncbi:hypothetical protein BC941DRAFT_434943 [Chlamydoabsidia padenii]|nr:hypothetical protein BC941DRAFT_434943 [Chlamydoabsidia padenii]